MQSPRLRFNHILILCTFHVIIVALSYHSRTLHRQPSRSFMSFSSISGSPCSILAVSFLSLFCTVRATRIDTSLENTTSTANTKKANLAKRPLPSIPFLMCSRRPFDFLKAYSVSLADEWESSSSSFRRQKRRMKGMNVALSKLVNCLGSSEWDV